MQFFATVPHDDEEQLALKLYARDLEEKNTYSLISREILGDWLHFQGRDEEIEDRKIILV